MSTSSTVEPPLAEPPDPPPPPLASTSPWFVSLLLKLAPSPLLLAVSLPASSSPPQSPMLLRRRSSPILQCHALSPPLHSNTLVLKSQSSSISHMFVCITPPQLHFLFPARTTVSGMIIRFEPLMWLLETTHLVRIYHSPSATLLVVHPPWASLLSISSMFRSSTALPLKASCSLLGTLFTDPPHASEPPPWCLVIPTQDCGNVKLVVLMSVDYPVIFNICHGVYVYNYFACMRLFAALCRVFLPCPELQLRDFLATSGSVYFAVPLVVKILALYTSALETESVRCSFRDRCCLLVVFPPKPPDPPDPPDYITSLHRLIGSWSFGSAVLTLSSFGDMSIVTACISTTSTSLANHDLPASFSGLILSVHWAVWRLTCFCPMARLTLFRLKLVSSHLPLYEDCFTLPLYEDRFILPLCEDRFTLPLYEEFVTLPLYEDSVTLPLCEDFGSFMEFITPLDSPFVLNGCVTRDVIKGSFDRRLHVSVAILERGNCALVAVLISGVRFSAQGFILLNNFIVEEIRGLLEDFYLFKCYVVIIFLSLSASFVVAFSFYVMMAMLSENTYSVYGD